MKHLKPFLTILILVIAVAGMAEYAMAQGKKQTRTCTQCGKHFTQGAGGGTVCPKCVAKNKKKPDTKPKPEPAPKPQPKLTPKPDNTSVVEDNAMFNLDDVTKSVQNANFKVYLINDGSVICYNKSSAQYKKINNGGAKDIGFLDSANDILNILVNDDTRKRINLKTGEIVETETSIDYDNLPLDKLTELANKGDAEAQYKLGARYFHGIGGVDKNAEKSVFWFEKAAEQGNVDAQSVLSFCYANGTGVDEDFDKAISWGVKAAEQGSIQTRIQTQNNLGNLYFRNKNYQEAIKWYKSVIDLATDETNNNVQNAKKLIGYCYFCAGDYNNAFPWLKDAAENGDDTSQYFLGICYLSNQSAYIDHEKAIYWLRKAAEQDNPGAKFNLGWCYECGVGVKKDLDQALDWYVKAASQGDPNAREALKRHMGK